MIENTSNDAHQVPIATTYRVNEPISNLKVRVKIVQQKPLLAEFLENDSDTRDSNFLEDEERIFSWQEKVFSPFEISFYTNETNCLADYQKEYHQNIKEKNVQGSQLYSYVQSDCYYPNDRLLTKPYQSKLSKRNESALPALQNRKPFSERYNKTVVDNNPNEMRIRSNHYVYTDRRTMYIMADLSRKDKTMVVTNDDLETRLCTIVFDEAHKTLTVNPDFASKRSYSIVNSSGVKFNYWIEHVSEKQSSMELQQQQDDSRREIRERLMHREAEILHGLQLTPQNVQRIFLKLDIMSAHNFSFNGLFITYYINLPEHWRTTQQDRLFGRTQRCNLKNRSAYFSYATDISLDYQLSSTSNSRNSFLQWPQLILTVGSLDSWTRYRTEGYAALPLPFLPGLYEYNIPTWRPTGSIINSLKRFFTGGTYELEDITQCGTPAGHESRILNKANLKVALSGFIKININIVHQCHTSLVNTFQSDYFERLSTSTLVNNIENIFEQFKAARERMMQIRNMNL